MSELAPETVGRRDLLGRSAAVAAATAAGALAVGAATTRPADAASGDAVLAGRSNSAESSTRLTSSSTVSTQPTLELVNDQVGPALRLDPLGEDTNFTKAFTEPGAFFTTGERPIYGGSDGDSKAGTAAVGLATLDDIDLIDEPHAYGPYRTLDTRTSSFPGPAPDPANFDSTGRLKAGRTLDVTLSLIDHFFTLKAVFLNVHSTGSSADGFLSVYPPGQERLSTLHFTKGATVANFTIMSVPLLDQPEWGPSFVLRVYASASTHVVLDLLGDIRNAVSSEPGAGLPHRTRRRTSPARRIGTKLKRPR